MKPRVFFVANGIYCDQISGGDIHFFQMARAAQDAGHHVHFFGGHALKRQLEKHLSHYEITLTDKGPAKPLDAHSLSGQLRLLGDYFRRFLGSLKALRQIMKADMAYAVSDYWFDVWPVLVCKAGRKLMIWHMEAPSLGQIIRRSRPDVTGSRLNSVYYWASQTFSLFLFRRCSNKHVLLVHPRMRQKLIARGYQDGELTCISFGVDVVTAEKAAHASKRYDVVWIGRVHRQKGIEDLLETLSHLRAKVDGFKAILIGNLKELREELERRGLADCVELSGFVSEEEKFRLFHASRVFLMTSRFEGSPRVVAEALVCNVPVVAYDVETYRPIYGHYLRYVPCFDRKRFLEASEAEVLKMRRGENYLNEMNIHAFRQEHSWSATGIVFCQALAGGL